MSRSFRTMREGREALRKSRQEAGLSTDYEIGESSMNHPHPTTPPAQVVRPDQTASTEASSIPEQQLSPEQQADILRQQETDQLKAVAEAAAEAMAKQDPRLVEGEVKLQKAKIRRENAAMVQACAMAVFAGLSACAVGLGMYSGHKTKGVQPAATPPGAK